MDEHTRRVAEMYEKNWDKRLALKRIPYGNTGYWVNNDFDLDDAAFHLVRELARRVGIGAGDRVLDVGSGFGQAAIDLYKIDGCDRIVGADVSASLVAFANELARKQGVEHAVRFELASATALDFEDQSFDKVIAIDAAVHFNTRDDFLAEAYRVLRTGGVLGLADSSAARPITGAVTGRIARKLAEFWRVPEANIYDLEEYRRRIERVGFTDVRIDPVGERVFIPAVKYITGASFRKRYREEYGLWKTRMTMAMYKQMGSLCERGYLTFAFITAKKP